MKTLILFVFLICLCLTNKAQYHYFYSFNYFDSVEWAEIPKEDLEEAFNVADSVFIESWQRLYAIYEEECLQDTIEVCRFGCYYSVADDVYPTMARWKWGEFDCRYYNTYKNYYKVGEKYWKWVPRKEPTPEGFIEWLINKEK